MTAMQNNVVTDANTGTTRFFSPVLPKFQVFRLSEHKTYSESKRAFKVPADKIQNFLVGNLLNKSAYVQHIIN